MNRTWGTLVLATLASFIILLLRVQGTATPTWIVVETFAVILSAFGIRVRMNQRSQESLDAAEFARVRMLLLIAGGIVILIPWLSKWIQTRLLGGTGEATELVWIGMLQYAALWFAGGAYQPRHEWLAFLMSCFLAIFGLATSDRQGMIQIVGPFAIIAAWWLMARYWNSIEGGFVASENIPLIRMRLIILLGMGMMAGIVLWLATSAGRETVLLDGFMPTSGGKQRADASARQGVGDGDMLVAARDEAYTFGAVDTDLFLDSEVPSMYDLVSEIYGEASNKKRKYARAISLDEQVKDVDREGTESKKNSREFSALRKPNDQSQNFRPEGTDSRAIVQVIGRTPAWLRLETFDRFEEATWLQSPALDMKKRNLEPELKMIQEKPWFTVQAVSSELVYPVRERFAIKVIQFESPRILSPSLLTHIHIDRIDQPDFFGWSSDGQMTMPNREHVPRLTIIHQLTQIPSLHSLRDPTSPLSHLSHTQAGHDRSGDFLSHYLQIDAPEQASAAVARQWLEQAKLVGSGATDWERVMAIVNRLRSSIQLDASSVPSEDCDSVVSFVLQQGRAPDYLIATTAALMIRDSGIPCRLCRGFLAKSERFDYRSGQTEVLPEDLHTWAEVYAHGMWIPIEPTGAYPMPHEHRTWWQWAIQTAWSIRDTVIRHPIQSAIAASLVALALYFRQRLLECQIGLLTAMMQWMPARTRIRWMLGTLRWRMWLWDEPIAQGATVERWLTEQLAIRSRASQSDAETFVRTVQGLAYAPAPLQQRTLAAHGHVVSRVCWSLVASGILGLLSRRRSSSSAKSITLN
jgi:transglutaminase-like putative cysteine protease